MKKKKEKCERQRKKYKNINKFLRVRPNVTIFCEQGLRRIVCRYVRYWLLGQKLTKQRSGSDHKMIIGSELFLKPAPPKITRIRNSAGLDPQFKRSLQTNFSHLYNIPLHRSQSQRNQYRQSSLSYVCTCVGSRGYPFQQKKIQSYYHQCKEFFWVKYKLGAEMQRI